jgi:hypothetical protein
MGAMTKLDISSNTLQAKGGKALAAGLKGNQVITELNIASNYLGVQDREDNTDLSGVIALADVIPGMGAMSALNLSENSLQADGVNIICEALLGAARCVTSLLFDRMLNVILYLPKSHQSMPATVC